MLKNLTKASICLLFISIIFPTQIAYSQIAKKVSGVVLDTAGLPMPAVRLNLTSALEDVSAISNSKGQFTFPAVKAAKFRLTATFIGYETFVKEFTVANSAAPVELEPIKIREGANQLEAVTIIASTPVKISEDTIEFAAPPVREGDAVEEMVKKLPGVVVDKDGNVTTEGKPITRIRVNGKDFFGDDVAAAIQNLPADIVKSLQIVDDYGDEARLTGIKSDEPEKVLNINILPEKNKGYFVQGTLGKGNEERYSGSVRGNTLKGEQQISFQSFLGNVNIRGGGGGNGITNTKSIGLNYRDKWGKNISSYGTYNFNMRDNNTIGSVVSQNIFAQRFDDQLQNNNTNNLSHRFEWNLEYNIDSANFIKVSPNFGYNSNDGKNVGNTLTRIDNESLNRTNTSLNNSSSPNFGGRINYNHRFAKKGRNFSLNGNFNSSDQDQDQETENVYTSFDSLTNISTVQNQHQQINANNSTRRNGFSASYNEPITQTSFISLNYSFNQSRTTNVRDIYDIDINGVETFNNSLSNNYQYEFITNRYGLNYRVVKKKYNYSLGVAAQPVILDGHDISRDITTRNETFNWIPNARFVYKFSTKSALTLNYNGRSNQPGFNQLQPTTDNSNLQNIITGNPNLKPEFTNSMTLQFNQSDIESGYTMFTNIQYSQTQDKIVTIRQNMGTQQLTSYTNTDGFYNLRGNYSFTKPFQNRKYMITYQGGANLSNNVAFNSGDRNIAKNVVLEQGLRFRFDLKDVMDTELSSFYTVNTTRYSTAAFEDRNTQRLRIGINGRNYFFKDLTIGYNFSKTINKGLNGGFNQNPMILTVFTEYRFLKGNAGSIRLQGFDLFNQNTGISRSVSGDQIVDSQYNQLARYFLLSFNLRLSKFGGGVNPNNSGNSGFNRPNGGFGGR